MNLLLHGAAIGFHCTGVFIGAVMGVPFLVVWCTAFAVYHGIRARGLLRDGVQA